MSLTSRPVAARTMALLVTALGITLIAQAQPVAVPLPAGPGVKKGKDKKKDDRDWTESIHLPVLPEARNKIEAVNKYLDGKDAISAQRWEDIIGVLQGMLDDPTDNFVEIDTKGSKVSIKLEVNRIIGSKFKDEGRQFYQRIVGPTADQKFKQAEEDNDMLLMAEVSQRYLHSKAGAAATIRLAGWHLDRGRYVQAALVLKNFLLRDSKEELGAPLLYKAALAFKRAGSDPELGKQAAKLWEQFEKASNKADVTLNSKTLTFAQLKAEYEKVVPVARLSTAEWHLARGNTTNTGFGQGGRPFLEPRFSYGYLLPSDDMNLETKRSGFEIIKDRMDKAAKLMDQKGVAAIPGTFPLASNGKVVFRGYDAIYCVATKEDKTVDPPIKPGELLWKSDTDHGLFQMMGDLGKRTTTDQFLLQYNSGPFGILTENPLVGTLSHDGQNAYFIDDMAIPPHPSSWVNSRMNGMPVQFGQFTDNVYFNKLKAVSLETGKLAWKVGEKVTATPRMTDPRFGGGPVAPPGGPAPKEAVPEVEVKKTTETFLADAIFLGPPLPLAGKLYVVIEKEGLHLVCLDPNRLEPSTRPSPTPGQKVPTLLWTQKLGEPNGALPEDAMRRYQGIHLAYKDGVLVVPTNAGAVLGIDLFSHSLIWAAGYKSNKSTQKPTMNDEMGLKGGGFRQVQPQMGGVSYDTTRERWHASAPIVVGNKVVFTAFDSDTVECVDLYDGRSAGKTPIARQENDMYVAGVYDEKVLIVGKGYVRFHSATTGQQLKEALATGVPTGVGAATENLYFLPIRASKDKSNEPGIMAIDFKGMRVNGTSRSRKREAAGNLLFHDGDLFSVTPAAVSSFQQLDNKIKETEDRLGKNPNDPVGLLDLAMLQHDDGRLQPAIENYRKALGNSPPEDARAKAREKMFEAITELLRDNFNAGEKLLPEYQKLCVVEVPATATEAQKQLLAEEELRRKSNFHALVANGKETQGKLLDAFEAYMAYGTLVGNKEMVSVPGETSTNARPDVWARAKIQNMIKNATPEQRKPLEEKVVTEWKNVRDSNDLDKLRGFVKVFGGMFEAGTDAKITLGDKLSASSNEDDVREAEYMLLALREGDDQLAAAKAVEAMARLYIRKGLLDDAVGMYAELGKKYAKTIVRDGKTGAEYFTDLITDKRFLPYLEPPASTWMFPKMRPGETVSGGAGGGQLMGVEMSKDALPYFRRYRLSIDMTGRAQGWAIKITDRVTGKEEWTSPGVGYHQWYYQFLQAGVPLQMVQIKGHFAVVTVHGNHPNTGAPLAKVHAFDLADKKKLWEVDLFGQTPNPVLLQNGAINQAMEADGLRLTFQDGWSTKVGQQWVVENTYTVILTRDGLVAKDNARGTVLWTKANVSPRTNLIGDGDHVFAYDANPDGQVSSVRCYRAADGVEILIPDSSAAFTSVKKAKFFGRRVLSADEADSKKVSIRLNDLLTGKDVWKKDVGEGWMLRSDNPDYTGYVTAAGDVVVLNSEDGKEVFKSKLDDAKKGLHLAKVNDAVLFGDAEKFFVVLNRPTEGNRFGYNPVFTQAIRSVKVNGTMYAFDRATGRKLWHTDEQFEDMSVSIEQFDELPLIIAGANHQKINANGGFEGQIQKLMAIDKTTGKLKYNKSGPQNNQYYAIATDPKAGTIEVMNYSGQKVRFVADDGKPTGKADPKTPDPKLGASGTRPGLPAIQLVPLPPKN